MACHLTAAAALAVSMLAAAPVLAEEDKAGAIEISHPWARATSPSAPTAGGYLTIVNHGAEADRLLGGTSPLAERMELHQMTMTEGVMTMRMLADGLEIPPRASVTLEPGSYHLMFVGPKTQLKEGDAFPSILRFENAGEIEMQFEVVAMGARPMRAAEAMDMDQGGQ